MKPLTDLSNEELRALLERIANPVEPTYNDVLAEIERRAMRQESTDDRRLTLLSVVIAAIAAIASMVAAVAAVIR